jgi:hypothetical protein
MEKFESVVVFKEVFELLDTLFVFDGTFRRLFEGDSLGQLSRNFC